ncbi:aminotransferase class IV [Paracoccaceae bacterium]|nr:aminotransferase class IV [Paracoccaceae bacterium]
MSKELSKGAAWMRGKIMPIHEASLPLNDWGLTRSDITYDVVPVIDGAFFRLTDYLNRFEASMKDMRLDPKINRNDIQKALTDMVSKSGLRNSYVSMVCSRGVPNVAGSRNPKDCDNHFFAWCVPYVNIIKPEIAQNGASAWISDTVKRIPEDSVNPRNKNYHWGDLTKGLFEAKDNNAETVILVDHKDNVTEGPGFNVFAVKDGKILTSDHGVLEGISRQTILDICDELSLKKEVRPISREEFMEADEIFLTTSSGGVVPITKVNDRIFSNDAPGEMTVKLMDCYWNWTKNDNLRIEIPYNQENSNKASPIKSSISKTFNRLIWLMLMAAFLLVMYVIYTEYPELIGLT